MAFNIEAVRAQASAYAAQVRRVMPVNKVYLFGSYAKGNASDLSDVDICFFWIVLEKKDALILLKNC